MTPQEIAAHSLENGWPIIPYWSSELGAMFPMLVLECRQKQCQVAIMTPRADAPGDLEFRREMISMWRAAVNDPVALLALATGAPWP